MVLPAMVTPGTVTTLDVVPSAHVYVGKVKDGVLVTVGIETEPELLLVIPVEPLEDAANKNVSSLH